MRDYNDDTDGAVVITMLLVAASAGLVGMFLGWLLWGVTWF